MRCFGGGRLLRYRIDAPARMISRRRRKGRGVTLCTFPTEARCRIASAGRNVRPPTMRTTPTSRPMDRPPWVVTCRRILVPASWPRASRRSPVQARYRHDDEKPAHQHGEADRHVVPKRVGGETREGDAVVRRRRRVGLQVRPHASLDLIGQSPVANFLQGARKEKFSPLFPSGATDLGGNVKKQILPRPAASIRASIQSAETARRD